MIPDARACSRSSRTTSLTSQTHKTTEPCLHLGTADAKQVPCLRAEALRREIHEGLQVVEQWNSAYGVGVCGKDGELTRRPRGPETSMLALHLLQAARVHLNTIVRQRILEDPRGRVADRRRLAPGYAPRWRGGVGRAGRMARREPRAATTMAGVSNLVLPNGDEVRSPSAEPPTITLRPAEAAAERAAEPDALLMLLAAARQGDERAFTQLVEPYRRELHQHCYRMLGSAHDADDVVQESLLRAWRSIARVDGRQSVRPWLYKIATNRCLTAIASRKRRELPTDLSPGTAPTMETAWLEPYPDARLGLDALPPEARVMARERVELAFVAALQQLSALQRAVLVLREALGFSAREVAELLETTVASVNSALQRARAVVRERTPSRSQQQELAGLGAEVRWIAARYAAAWASSDVEGIVAMLAEDVRLAMPPLPAWYEGPEAVRAVLASGPITHRWRLLPTWANGQLAFGCYRWHDQRRVFVGEGLDVLTLRAGRIVAITAFLVADLQGYGLPSTISS